MSNRVVRLDAKRGELLDEVVKSAYWKLKGHGSIGSIAYHEKGKRNTRSHLIIILKPGVEKTPELLKQLHRRLPLLFRRNMKLE